MKNLIRLFFLLIAIFLGSVATAQNEVPMADGMRAEGKIYVVVAIILVIFAGLIAFLIATERKVSKIEKKLTGKD